jgi:hypothetical protein
VLGKYGGDRRSEKAKDQAYNVSLKRRSEKAKDQADNISLKRRSEKTKDQGNNITLIRGKYGGVSPGTQCTTGTPCTKFRRVRSCSSVAGARCRATIGGRVVVRVEILEILEFGGWGLSP